MNFAFRCLLSTVLLAGSFQAFAAENLSLTSPSSSFTPFTGKITRNKVRLRLQPHLDGQILRELARDDLLVVIGDEDEFYAVKPLSDTKVFVFRTFVLDNQIEGDRVNVRLEPDTASPVVAQMNRGDKVEGTISPLNSKWLEITPPPSTKFYVCKEYVEKIGDANTITLLEKRLKEVNSILNATDFISQSELQKPFQDIHLETVLSNLNKIIQHYSDFPPQVARAKEMLAAAQSVYIEKKIAYLEAKTSALALSPPLAISEVNTEKEPEESSPTVFQNSFSSSFEQALNPEQKTANMVAWIPAEEKLYRAWQRDNPSFSLSDYYEQQEKDAIILRGLVEANHRAIKNKPGDYILINKTTNLPIAYLYSTCINLQDLTGKELILRVAPRSNNNFAFPAYYVLAIE